MDYLTSQNANPFTAILKPRREVLEGRIEEALNLANIYIYNELREKHPEAGEIKPSPLHDSNEFLKRTYISKEMKQVILTVMGGLAGVSNVYIDERGGTLPVTSRVIVIPSALGGGKTHLLATLYYIVRLFKDEGDLAAGRFEDRELKHGLRHVFNVLADNRRDIRVVAIVGDTYSLAPAPDKPLLIDNYKIYTPWGLLGYLVGDYDRLKEADENHRPPAVDEIRKTLAGKPVLILLDEAVEYMARAVSLDRSFPGYSEAFLSFIRNLAQAVSETPNTVLVVTLPVEYREGRIGKGYQHPEYVERVLDMVHRAGPLYIPPLVFEKDIASVFKRRLFENADSQEMRENLRLLIQMIEERARGDSILRESIRQKYGDVLVLIERLRESYPFHPYFIELLVNIALKNPGLGLTRYLLVFVARLVKYIYDMSRKTNREYPVSMITPWIIPVDDTGFRTYLLQGMIIEMQSDFQRIYDQDVKNHSIRLEELVYAVSPLSREETTSLLRACITRTVWLSTIPGQGSRSGDSLKLYLRTGDIVAVVYEPILMRSIAGADILNTLKDLSGISTYLAISHDDRVFYAVIPDILSLLRRKYRQITDFDASIKLERLVHKRSFRQGRLIKNIIPIYTSREREIEEIVRQEAERDTDPALFIYLSLDEPPLNIAELVIRRNNIVLLLPDLKTSPLELGLHYTERFRGILGEEPVRVKEYLKSLLRLLKAVDDLRSEREHLKEAVGEQELSYVLDILEKTKRELEKLILVSIYTVLRKAVLGLKRRQYEVDLRPFDEEIKDLSVLSRLLEESLERSGVLTEWTWSSITRQLVEWSDIWDADFSPRRPVRVGDIWNQLLYSPGIEPHLTRFEEFMRALEEAYLSNIIAFKYNDLLIWLKHPYTQGEAEKLIKEKTSQGATIHDWERDVTRIISDKKIRIVDLEIISPRSIIRDYIEKIRKQAEIRPGEKVIRRLVVYTESGIREFEEFIASHRSEIELVDVLSRYPVVMIEETPQRIFQIQVLNVSGRPFVKGEPVELEFQKIGEVRVDGRIESDEDLDVQITLEARELGDKRVGKKETIRTKGPSVFNISQPISSPGEYVITLKAEEPGGYIHPVIPVARVKIRGVSCREKSIKSSEVLMILNEPGVQRLEIRRLQLDGLLKRGAVGELYDILAHLGRYDVYVSGVVEAKMKDGEVRVEFKNTRSDRVAGVLRAIGIEDLVLDLEITGLTRNMLVENKQISSILLDQHRAISSLVEFEIEECVEV